VGKKSWLKSFVVKFTKIALFVNYFNIIINLSHLSNTTCLQSVSDLALYLLAGSGFEFV
jgi:hypothetical protein